MQPPLGNLKKRLNPKCNEYLIYGQSKYRLRAGVRHTGEAGVEVGETGSEAGREVMSGTAQESPAQGTKPRTGLSEEAEVPVGL